MNQFEAENRLKWTDKFLLLFHTLKYLKGKQILYRLYHLCRNKIRNITGFEYSYFVHPVQTSSLVLKDSINYQKRYENSCFTFINLSHKVEKTVNWNYAGYGKLWTYNLNYFEFLNQRDISVDDGMTLIKSFIYDIKKNKVGLEPFPISLRVINWIKFLTRNRHITHSNRELSEINSSLFAQLQILVDNIEYHLLGNHLLENGFALLFGAYYFEDRRLYQESKKILISQLDEQILDDGAHFELSPMYHQIMLLRVLDCVNLVQNNKQFENELLDILERKASVMLSWLNKMTFRNGNMPLLNDSTNGIAPTTLELSHYANTLKITNFTGLKLASSGYRIFTNDKYEMVIDVGNIGPDYLPAHAHSDTFSYELYLNGKPFIIDTGTSTYEENQQRLSERCTRAHNTVQVEAHEQSEVWGNFRVGKRAKVTILEDEANKIVAVHNGYKKINVLHQRGFEAEVNKLIITDIIKSRRKYNCFSFIHFHPDVKVENIENKIFADNNIIYIKGSKNIYFEDYGYAFEFNKLIPAKMAVIEFYEYLETYICI